MNNLALASLNNFNGLWATEVVPYPGTWPWGDEDRRILLPEV